MCVCVSKSVWTGLLCSFEQLLKLNTEPKQPVTIRTDNSRFNSVKDKNKNSKADVVRLKTVQHSLQSHSIY